MFMLRILRIKRSVAIALSAAIVLCGVVSCVKDHSAHKVFKATSEPTAHDGKLSLSGFTLRWSADDTTSIYDASSQRALYYVADGVGSSHCELAYHSGATLSSGPYHAVYPANIHTAATQVTLPAVQRSTDGSLQSLPMYAVSNNADLMFYNLCGVLHFRLTSSGVSVSTIAVTTTGTNTHGTASISGHGTSSRLSTPNGGDVSVLAINMPQDISTPKDFYMYLPAGTYNTFRVLFTSADGAVCAKNANGSVVVERGKITTITLSSLSFDSYRFSTSPSSSVIFAPGNLQYIGSADQPYWQFAARQYDYLGFSTGQDSKRSDVDRDLFGWGTSGWNNGNVFYKPYSTSDTSKTPYGSSKGNGYGPKSGSSYSNPLTGSFANADWGVFNPIRNGGNVANRWRTPTQAEWDYLLKTRNASTVNGTPNARFAQATVNGLGGLIIFPDTYVHPVGITQPTNINNGSASWSSNVYTDADWTAMDHRGAIFLPATGFRKGAEIRSFGADGNVWTSTNYGAQAAYNVYFVDGNLVTNNHGARYIGRAVRLVRD